MRTAGFAFLFCPCLRFRRCHRGGWKSSFRRGGSPLARAQSNGWPPFLVFVGAHCHAPVFFVPLGKGDEADRPKGVSFVGADPWVCPFFLFACVGARFP